MTTGPFRQAPRFYAFRQNNSAGLFDEGVGHVVLVEAATADEANQRAQAVGVYFHGCAMGRDCPCCGDRWWPADDHDALPFERPLSAETLREHMSEYRDKTVLRVVYHDEQEVFTGGPKHMVRKLRPATAGVPGDVPVADEDAFKIPGLD